MRLASRQTREVEFFARATEFEPLKVMRNLTMSMYQYNIKFQNLDRYARQEVPDEKSMIYYFKGGLREDL